MYWTYQCSWCVGPGEPTLTLLRVVNHDEQLRESLEQREQPRRARDARNRPHVLVA